MDGDIFSFWEFIAREMLEIVTFTTKNDLESIPNDSGISPEPFRSNFHIIVALWDPKTGDFQLNLIKNV